MTLAQWADVSTIGASVTAVFALFYIAIQAHEIRKQTELSLVQIQEFTRRSQVDVAYQMISNTGRSNFFNLLIAGELMPRGPRLDVSVSNRR